MMPTKPDYLKLESLSEIDVFILCGGQGKRLKCISGINPKPMVKFGNRYFLEILINYFTGLGFRRFILGLGYKGELIQKHFSQKINKDREIIFSQESYPLGTGGALKNSRHLIKSRFFFVLNGDSFCKFDPRKLLRFHKQKKALVSVFLSKLNNASKDCGLVRLRRNCSISNFQEKGTNSHHAWVSAGMYIFDKDAFKFMPKKNKFSLEYDFFPLIYDKKFFGFKESGQFFDIGTPLRYHKARKYFLMRKGD